MQDYDAVEIASHSNGYMSRNKIISVSQIADYFGNQNDTYISLAMYDTITIDNWMDEHGGSIAGNDLAVWFPYITYDCDHMDIDQIVKFLIRLQVEYDITEYRLYFSGAKGFHIQIPSEYFGLKPSPTLNKLVGDIAKTLAEGVLEYDPSIYDKQRIFRLPNTINTKTGLYKIPLVIEEMTEVEDIHALAKEQRELPKRPHASPLKHLVDIANDLLRKKEVKPTTAIPVSADTLIVPPGKKHCIYSLMDGVKQGTVGRDPAGLRIADYFKKEGLDSTLVHGILSSWNEKNDPKLTDKNIDTIIHQSFNNAYDFGCNDSILKSECKDKCYLFKSKNEGHVFKDILQMEKDYKAMIQMRKESKIKTGIDEVDKATRGLAPQMVMTIIARSGAFKSAILQNILMGYDFNKPSLWFSKEMPSSLVYERLVQIEKGMTGVDVEHHYANEIDVKIDLNKYSNFYIDASSGLTVEDIEKRIQLFKETVNPELYLVGIDYLQIIKGKGNLFERVEHAAQTLKEIAKRNNVAIVLLSQTSREDGGDGTKELGMDSGKGGGAIEEAADFVLNIWKSKDTNRIFAKIGKNRVGKAGQKFEIQIDPSTLTIENFAKEVKDGEDELPW